jgi:hypothetical protein
MNKINWNSIYEASILILEEVVEMSKSTLNETNTVFLIWIFL